MLFTEKGRRWPGSLQPVVTKNTGAGVRRTRCGPGPARYKVRALGKGPGSLSSPEKWREIPPGGYMREWLFRAPLRAWSLVFIREALVSKPLSLGPGTESCQRKEGTAMAKEGKVLTWLSGRAAGHWGRPTDGCRCRRWCRPCSEPPASVGSHIWGEKSKKKERVTGRGADGRQAGPTHWHCQPIPVRCPWHLESHHQNHSSSQTLFPPNSSFKSLANPWGAGRRPIPAPSTYSAC